MKPITFNFPTEVPSLTPKSAAALARLVRNLRVRSANHGLETAHARPAAA